MTEPPTSKEQIEGYLYAFKSLVKEHNSRGDVSLIRLIFDEDRDTTGRRAIMTGTEVVDVDLKRPFKETTLDGNIRGWFERLPAGSIDEWSELRRPERWMVEPGFILDIPEIMKISSFMDAYKFPELAKRYSDKVPKTLDEMMVRHDDFVRSEEAFANTELPKGEVSESSRKAQGLVSRREERFHRGGYWANKQRNKGQNTYNNREGPWEGYFVLTSIRGSMSIGFVGEVIMPVCKIKLEVTFEDEGLCRKIMMKFVVIRASSPYNIILGRTGLKTIRAIPSSIHSMMKCPYSLRWRSENVSIEEEKPKEVSLIEEILVNPAYPDKLVTIEGDLSGEYKVQLRELRVLVPDRSLEVAREFKEWLKAGIVRLVKYPTWISNSVLVKKADESWRMCIDFKNSNSACLEDYHPLSNID
ncbi:hypothetical protein Tco_0194432 [Tanacetum coccineum]